MADIGHVKCQAYPFKLTCENCSLELTIYVPDQYSVEDYMQIIEPFLDTPQLKTITKQKDDLCTVETINGETLQDVKFELIYLCKLSIQTERKQNLQPQSPCSNFKDVEEDQLHIKAIIYKKPSTNQEIRIRPEKLIAPF